MTLAFQQHINGQPTYFVEKIYRCFKTMELTPEHHRYIMSEFYNTAILHNKPKLHTIREDKSDRWRAGMDIHFVINNRTPNRLQFLPVMKCVSVQKIEIIYVYDANKTTVTIYIDNELQGQAILLNSKLKNYSTTFEKISINDGFDSVNDFIEYFSGGFTGKIIHWTDLKY